jgi:putative nucleotidyltransferase with HDIG domain
MDFSILLSFLIIIRKRIWADNFQVLLLSIPIILVSFLGFLSFQIQGDNQNIPLEYLVMIPAFSTFIAIVFDSRTAFYTTVSMAFTLAAVRGNDYFFGLTMLFTGTIAAYCVKDIQDRTQMFSSIIYIFIGFAIAIFVVGFERGYSFAIMMPQLFLALINSILAPVITLLLLMLVNKIDGYNIVTNLTLREYLQKEHPLIKQLKEKANGTFEHSREVAQMAELAASAIDANALLVKVGAYFHDIGKMNNPDFFTENYEKADDFENPHTSLTPKQSAEKIIQHICDGIKMAKEAKLPQVILDFIPEHHGTTLVKHFYNVALNNAKETGETVDKNDFRYPGPKPQSKETAILMLCDSAQAVSKSVTDIKQFTNIFESIIEERIKFEQFAECNLTLQDIATIKEVIYKEIKGKIHTRTQYAVANEPEKKEEA